MNPIGRIFGRLGLKVKSSGGVGFQGSRLPSEDDLAELIARMKPEPIQYAPPGPKLNIITTSSGAEGPKVHDIAEPESSPAPEREAKLSLRERWRRLRDEVNRLEQK